MNELQSSDTDPVYASYLHEDGSISLDYPEHWEVSYEPNQKLCLLFASPEDENTKAIILGAPNRLDSADLSDEEDIQGLLHCALEQCGIDSEAQPSALLYYPSQYAKATNGAHNWSTIHNGLLLLIQINYPEPSEHIYRPIFERMLSSIRIDCEKKVRDENLLEEVFELLKQRSPDQNCEIINGRINFATLEIGVDNLSLSVSRQPDLRQQLIEEFVGAAISVLQQRQSIGNESWEQIKSHLFPMIRPDTIVHSLYRRASSEAPSDDEQEDPSISRSRLLVHSTWLADLVVCYAIDTPMTLRMVSEEDLQRWGVDAAQLHEMAISNLQDSDLPQFAGMPGPEGDLVLGGFGEGGISTKSSYLLHPELYQMLRPRFKGRMWAAIPARDALMVFSSEYAKRETLLSAVSTDYANSDHAVSDRLFEITADGIALS